MRRGIFKIKLLIIFVFCLFAFSNCKKEGESLSDFLTSKTWKKGSVDLNPSTNPPGEHQYDPIRNCDTDDRFTFTRDGNLVIERGSNKCDPNEQQYETLKYSIDRETNILIIDSTTFTLSEESQNQIKYYKPVPNGSYLTNYIIFLLQ